MEHVHIQIIVHLNMFYSNRLLGNFALAAQDLRLACKIDFDEVADEWLREVTPNVSLSSYDSHESMFWSSSFKIL